MPQVPVLTFEDLARLDESIDRDRPSAIMFLFRGQARADRPLIPSLTRSALACALTPAEALDVERCALAEFYRQAHLHLPPQLIAAPDDALSWWLTMQHYNAPTRLLDWTRSLFVAAYFAVEKEDAADGAIWIMHVGRVMHETKDRFGLELPNEWDEGARSLFLDPSAPAALFHVTAKAQTDRMGAQQIGFTVSPAILADHGAILDSYFGTPRLEQVQFLRAIIPARSKPEILRRLRQVNITAQALFPGIDGLGRSVAELVRADCDYRGSVKGRREKG